MKKSSSYDKNNKYFNTDHLKDDLKSRSVRGGAITMIAQVLKFSLSLGSNVLLARLLTPQDYGLVGMVMAVTGFISIFKDLGLSMATVQKEEVNHEQVSNLFWVNLVLSLITALLTVAIAPGIAWFYKEPRLIGITIALAAGFIISGLGVQHSALLNRQMQYKSLMLTDVLSILAGVVAAIVSAFYGAGYWSLVIMPLVTAGIGSTGYWLACSWRPGLPARKSGVYSMLAFGGNLTAFSIVNYFARNLDNILIGKYWGTEQLGFYAKAYQLLLLPLNQINGPISGVVIPSLSRIQQDPQYFRYYYLKALSLITFLSTPTIIFMIVCAQEIIQLLLGSQWSETVIIFQFLGVSAIIQPIYNTSGWLYVATGRTDRMFKWGGFISSLIVCSFLIGLPYGAKGVAFTYGVAIFCLVFPAMYFATRRTLITLLDLVNTVKQPFLSSLIAGMATLAFKTLIDSSLPTSAKALICFFVMFVTYIIVIFYLFSMKEFYFDVLRNFKR